MKILIGLFILIIFSCSKNQANGQQSIEMETGIYEGNYQYLETNTTINKFKVEVIKVSSTIYQIRQIDTGLVPTFNMEDKNHSYPFVFFLISTQTVNSQTFSGNGGVSGGFDAEFTVTTKSLYFSITFNNISVKTIYFNGNKL